jgi:hypothetical protein
MPKKANIIRVGRTELGRFTPPEDTATHHPVPYVELANQVVEVAKTMIVPHGYELTGDNYEVREDGSQMFGTLVWSDGSRTDMGLAVGIRNSYDKSIAAGLCMGASVFVCSNMMFNGDITVMRKNTGDSIEDMRKSILLAMYDCQSLYGDITHRLDAYKEIQLNTAKVEHVFGRAFCQKILAPQQLTEAWREWNAPTHEELGGNTVFSLYQAMNTPLKKCNPRNILEKHKALDTMFREIA